MIKYYFLPSEILQCGDDMVLVTLYPIFQELDIYNIHCRVTENASLDEVTLSVAGRNVSHQSRWDGFLPRDDSSLRRPPSEAVIVDEETLVRLFPERVPSESPPKTKSILI